MNNYEKLYQKTLKLFIICFIVLSMMIGAFLIKVAEEVDKTEEIKEKDEQIWKLQVQIEDLKEQIYSLKGGN